MAVITAAGSAGTTRSLISGPHGGDADVPRKIAVYAAPANTGFIYLGGPEVTIDSGLPLGPGATFTADLTQGEALHGITETGAQAYRVLRAGV